MPSPLRNRASRHFLLAEESVVADRGEEANDSTRAFQIISPLPYRFRYQPRGFIIIPHLKKWRKSASRARRDVSAGRFFSGVKNNRRSALRVARRAIVYSSSINLEWNFFSRDRSILGQR